MRRRQFITLLGSAAAGWPLAARGQQRAMPLIAFLNSQSAAPFAHMLGGFRRGLRDAGFIEGQNIAIEYRWAEGQYDRLPALANDLIRQDPVVLVATGGEPVALAAKEATQAIPIVFIIGGDPVRQRLVSSMNRPGGNVTGLTLLTTELEGKRLGLLQELVPHARSIAVLINPDFPPAERQRQDVLGAAARAGLRATTVLAKSERDSGRRSQRSSNNAQTRSWCAPIRCSIAIATDWWPSQGSTTCPQSRISNIRPLFSGSFQRLRFLATSTERREHAWNRQWIF